MRRAAAAISAAILIALALGGVAAAEGPDRITEAQATRAADRDAKVVEERRENHGLTSSARIVDGNWEVAYFADGKEVALALVDPLSGQVRESWTGYQVTWKMARGYSGAFGHKLNAPYVFLPLCLIFLVGLLDWRRLRRIANLDLLVLLGFAVSHFFFNRAEIGVSVPIVYPLLAYLLARAVWIGIRGSGIGLRPAWRASWLLIAALFLIGVRVGLNMADSGAIDVGYAGVVGADRIVHGEPIYDNFPDDVSQGDTYGPVNYLAYVPFERIWPWSGSWDDLPAAHGAAIAFDLAAFGLLILLGYRIRPGPAGRKLAATLAFGWAAFPYTAYVLESNSNDSLVAALLIAVLLALSRPALRGATAALATFAKFVPALLVPMLLTYRPQGEDAARLRGDPAARSQVEGAACREAEAAERTQGEVADLTPAGGADVEGPRTDAPRPPAGPSTSVTGPGAWWFVIGLILVTVIVMTWPAINPGLATVWRRTITYQADRDSPFSIWGQVGLEPLRLAILTAVGIGSLALAFRPRRKTLTQVAAFGAALIIGIQLTAQHWFYLYIVWFYPLLLVAMATAKEREPSPARSSRRARPS